VPTRKPPKEIVPAVFLRATADELRSKCVTPLCPLGTDLSLASPRYALWIVRIVEYRVRSFTQPFSECGELDVWVWKPVRKDDRCQVKSPQPWDRLDLQNLVVFVNNPGRIWNISPSVTLPSHMEVRIGVFGEPEKEYLEERVHVFACLQTPVDFRSTRVLVGEPDADWLIDEEDVEVLVPTVWVPRNIPSVVRDLTRSELEQQPGE